MSNESSRLRQRLVRIEETRVRQLQLVLGERGPLIRGTVGDRSRVCGNPGCKCARGERHVSKYLSAAVDGRTRQVHVPAGDEVEVSAAVGRYRQFRAARAQLAALTRQQLELVDALGNSLLEAYPPDNPLPPPKRRGRPPKPRDASQG